MCISIIAGCSDLLQLTLVSMNPPSDGGSAAGSCSNSSFSERPPAHMTGWAFTAESLQNLRPLARFLLSETVWKLVEIIGCSCGGGALLSVRSLLKTQTCLDEQFRRSKTGAASQQLPSTPAWLHLPQLLLTFLLLEAPAFVILAFSGCYFCLCSFC